MGWMPQSKDKDWLNRYKNKTPIYVVYKRPTSEQGSFLFKQLSNFQKEKKKLKYSLISFYWFRHDWSDLAVAVAV